MKTVENGSELAAVLRLRHDVFYRELLGKRKIFQLDVDRFDFFCDHLVIIDNRTEDMVGTYRLNASTFSNRFYTESEFHFDDIRNLPLKAGDTLVVHTTWDALQRAFVEKWGNCGRPNSAIKTPSKTCSAFSS